MFIVNEYKITFKRRWHCYYPSPDEPSMGIKNGDGRYDTVCEIYLQQTKPIVNSRSVKKEGYNKLPSFTGIAKLHPNDQPDKIVGKKIALRNALAKMYPYQGREVQHIRKLERTAIWKAFFGWVDSWKNQPNKALTSPE